MTVPGGSVVDVIRCGGEWCNVMADGRPGYMIARNLGLGGPAPVAVVRRAGGGRRTRPYYGYGPYYGPRYYGPRLLLRPAPLLAPLVSGSNALMLQGYHRFCLTRS